jgi:hypothetical protein
MAYVVAVPVEGAEPTPIAMPGNCAYPWCRYPEFTTDSSEIGVRASVPGEPPGMMHVRHTTLAARYAGGLTEYQYEPEYHYEPLDLTDPQLPDKRDVGITELAALAKRVVPENLRLVVTGSRRTPQRDVFHVEVYRL